MLFIFTVTFFLRTYGFGSAEVVAPNPVEALRLAAGTEFGWMLNDSHVEVSSIKRGLLAHCAHWNSDGVEGDDMWECEDCGLVYRDQHDPSATKAGFRAYCENLRVVPCEV